MIASVSPPEPDADETRPWFHEYGFTGPENFDAALEAVEALGFKFVYGGADARADWTGWPAYADALAAALAESARMREALERISKMAGPGESGTGAAGWILTLQAPQIARAALAVRPVVPADGKETGT